MTEEMVDDYLVAEGHWKKRVAELEAERDALRAKVSRLTARGIEDMRWEIGELKAERDALQAQVERLAACVGLVGWNGVHGSCGVCGSPGRCDPDCETRSADAILADRDAKVCADERGRCRTAFVELVDGWQAYIDEAPPSNVRAAYRTAAGEIRDVLRALADDGEG